MRNGLRSDAGEALARLQSVVHTLTALPMEQDAPEILLAQAIAAVGADGGVLGIVNDGVFIDTVTYRGYSEERARSYGRLSVGPGYPLTDAVWRQESIWLCGSADRLARYPDLTGPVWPPTIACLPLLLGGRCVGVLGLTIEQERPCFTSVEQAVLLTLADICAFVLHRWQLGMTAAKATPEPEPGPTTADHLATTLHHLTHTRTATQLSSLIATMLPPAVGASSTFLAIAGQPAGLSPDEPQNRAVFDAYTQRPLPLTSSSQAHLPGVAHVTGLEENQLPAEQEFATAITVEHRSWAAYPVVCRGTELAMLGVVWHRPRKIPDLLHSQLGVLASVCAAVLDTIPATSP